MEGINLFPGEGFAFTCSGLILHWKDSDVPESGLSGDLLSSDH